MKDFNRVLEMDKSHTEANKAAAVSNVTHVMGEAHTKFHFPGIVVAED